MSRHLSFSVKIVLSLILVVACALPASASKPTVFVTILPQKYFIDQIAGDLIDTQVLVMPGANPHMYEPTPHQMVALSKSKAYFAIGITLEDTWLPRIGSANVGLRVFQTQEGIKKIAMVEHHHDDDHANEGMHEEKEEHHDHTGLDPHVWLDPIRAKQIATNICKGLIAIDPANTAVYEKNLTSLLSALDATHHQVSAILADIPANQRTFMVFHPSWGYFADRYHLTQIAIEAGGKEPSPRHLAEIMEHCREHNIHVIFVQPQFSLKSAKTIATELNAEVAPLDPLAEDLNTNLIKAAQAFKRSLDKK